MPVESSAMRPQWHRVTAEKQGSNWTDYIFFGSQRIVKQTGSSLSTATFIHTDHLNSTRVCTDSSGNSTGSCNYEPFGEYQGGSCSLPVNYRYAGMEWDSETQLYHTWFRQYDLSQGRWMSVDPLAGSADDPQSVNRYAYVLNDPANLTDPLGLFPCPLDNIGDPDRSYAGCDPWGNFRFHGGPRGFEDVSILEFFQRWERIVFETLLENYVKKKQEVWTRDQINAFLELMGYTLVTTRAGDRLEALPPAHRATANAHYNNLGDITDRGLGLTSISPHRPQGFSFFSPHLGPFPSRSLFPSGAARAAIPGFPLRPDPTYFKSVLSW